jgi:uncharacterized repeat protein (TIGR01451 family)
MAGPPSARNGSTIIYNLDVANLSPDAAANAVLVDQLPYGTVFEAITAGGWTCSAPGAGTAGGTITCTDSSLAGATTLSTSIGVKVKAHTGRGVVPNSASVSSDTLDPNTSNNAASISTTVTK